MNTKKRIALMTTTFVSFFVNLEWFIQPCARSLCEDFGFSPQPIVMFPNFYRSYCDWGGCGEAGVSLDVLISDFIFFAILTWIVFWIIDKATRKKLAEDEAVNAVLLAQNEPTLRGDLRELMKKVD